MDIKQTVIFQTITDLTFLSKVLEREVAFNLNKYLINDTLNESLQSA